MPSINRKKFDSIVYSGNSTEDGYNYNLQVPVFDGYASHVRTHSPICSNEEWSRFLHTEDRDIISLKNENGIGTKI